jgi:hypothetical protein
LAQIFDQKPLVNPVKEMVVGVNLPFSLPNVVEEVTSHVGQEIAELLNDRWWICLSADLGETFQN